MFEKFPERPLMTKLNRIPSDFATPKARDSFVTKFVNDTKVLINDETLKVMSKNQICINNLFNLDLRGSNKITEKVIFQFNFL